MTAKMYTQEEVLEEKNKSFQDGLAHSKPSPETTRRLDSLEDTLKGFKDIPITLKLIEKDIKELLDGKVLVQDNTKRIARLEMWQYGIMTVIAVGGFFFSYIVSTMQTNLDLKVEKVTRDTITEVLSNYEFNIIK